MNFEDKTIAFAARPYQLEQLKKDFKVLNDSEELPCECDAYFTPASKLHYKGNIATTTFGKEIGEGELLPPYIEFDSYFNFEEKQRKFIMLHEIIHACQRKNELYDINTETRKIFRELVIEKIEKSKIAKNRNLEKIKILEDRINIIKGISEIPFELCDDVYFKKKYFHLFPDIMNLHYEHISGYIDQIEKFSEIYQKYYVVYREMLRTKYLYELNKGLELEEKFYKLFVEWDKKYLEFFNEDERKILDEFVNPLTTIKKIENKKIIGSLKNISKHIWNLEKTK